LFIVSERIQIVLIYTLRTNEIEYLPVGVI